VADMSIVPDKPEYVVGDVARFTVRIDFDGPRTDTWMKPTIYSMHDGQPVAPDEYPDYPMHESDDETSNVGWFVIPLLRGTWGLFRAEAMIYEPERQEIGTAAVDFEVRKNQPR
jgi:hypothetical protein